MSAFADRGASIAFPNGHRSCHVCGTCKRNRVLAHQAAQLGQQAVVHQPRIDRSDLAERDWRAADRDPSRNLRSSR